MSTSEFELQMEWIYVFHFTCYRRIFWVLNFLNELYLNLQRKSIDWQFNMSVASVYYELFQLSQLNCLLNTAPSPLHPPPFCPFGVFCHLITKVTQFLDDLYRIYKIIRKWVSQTEGHNFQCLLSWELEELRRCYYRLLQSCTNDKLLKTWWVNCVVIQDDIGISNCQNWKFFDTWYLEIHSGLNLLLQVSVSFLSSSPCPWLWHFVSGPFNFDTYANNSKMLGVNANISWTAEAMKLLIWLGFA